MQEVGTEKDYDEIRKLGTKLHIPTPEMHWGFKVEMPDGDVVHEHDERGHSWVRNAYNALVSQFCAVNGYDINCGDGRMNFVTVIGDIKQGSPLSLQVSTPELIPYGFLGSSGSNAQGIVVGTGTSPYHFDQYKLSMIVPNGTSNGQLSYQQSNYPIKSWDSVARKYTSTFVRILNNNSSASITLTEVGIYCNIGGGGSNMAVRDVLGTPVVVPAGGKLTITYSIYVTFPATDTGNTLHLLNFDNSFDDERGKQWVGSVGSKLSTTQVKFGTSSYYQGDTSSYLKYPPTSDFDFGTSDFTLEVFAFIPKSGGAIWGGYPKQLPISMAIYNDRLRYNISSNFTSYDVANGTSGTITITYNVWNHFAIVRSGNTITSYINGVVDKTFDVTGKSFNYSASCFYLGGSYEYGAVAGTYFDSFRVSKVARYTNPFTPPTSAFVLD